MIRRLTRVAAAASIVAAGLLILASVLHIFPAAAGMHQDCFGTGMDRVCRIGSDAPLATSSYAAFGPVVQILFWVTPAVIVAWMCLFAIGHLQSRRVHA